MAQRLDRATLVYGPSGSWGAPASQRLYGLES